MSLNTPTSDLTTLPAEQHFTRVTLYFKGEDMSYGIEEIACRTLKVECKPYAQHTHALHLTYVPVGKSKEREFVLCHPYVVVVPTWKGTVAVNNFEAPTPGSVPGVTITKGRYRSCDPRWMSDLDASLSAAGIKPLLHVVRAA